MCAFHNSHYVREIKRSLDYTSLVYYIVRLKQKYLGDSLKKIKM